MLCEVTGAHFPLPPRLLEKLVLFRRDERQRRDYALHLLWLVGLQLFTLCGGRDYPVPPPPEAFARTMEESVTAEDVRRRILQRLQEERSEA